MLESDAAARAAGNVPADKLADLRKRIEALMNMDSPADPLHQQLDAELHGLIAEYCGNELLAGMIANLRQKTRMFSLKRLEKRMVPVCGEHMAMIDALARGDAEAASAETMRHIDNIRQSIIDKLAGM
jgi:DNA-binding GntR family transcriptional regulator